jgi:hypothetical protein
MQNRRHLLAKLLSYVAVTFYLIRGVRLGWITLAAGDVMSGKAVARPRPAHYPAIRDLLGQNLFIGAAGRLTLFGRNLEVIEALNFDHPDIISNILSIADNEIVIEIVVPENIDPGVVKFTVRTKSGDSYNGSYVTIIVGGASQYGYVEQHYPIYSAPGNLPSPSAGWSKHGSNDINLYYKDRPILDGIGGDLL